MLCMQNGVVPQTPEEEYEMDWYFETNKDHDKKDLHPAIFQEGCDEEIINKFIANAIEMSKKLEERWADGRQYVAGNTLTAADFTYLANITMIRGNTGIRNPSINTKFDEQMPVGSYPNIERVVGNIKALCQASVDALQPTWI